MLSEEWGILSYNGGSPVVSPDWGESTARKFFPWLLPQESEKIEGLGLKGTNSSLKKKDLQPLPDTRWDTEWRLREYLPQTVRGSIGSYSCHHPRRCWTRVARIDILWFCRGNMSMVSVLGHTKREALCSEEGEIKVLESSQFKIVSGNFWDHPLQNRHAPGKSSTPNVNSGRLWKTVE